MGADLAENVQITQQAVRITFNVFILQQRVWWEEDKDTKGLKEGKKWEENDRRRDI
jgi:hypothetical protein